MSEFVQNALFYASLDQTHWLSTLALILLFAFFERLFPRTRRKNPSGRLIIVLTFGVFAYFAIWIFKNAIYVDTIQLFLNFQFFSLSRAQISTPILYIVSVSLIDLSVYVFHVLSHKFSPLWGLHAVHHADEHVDATTGLLHHPVETITSFVFVLFVCIVLGIPVIALVLYAALTTLHNLFSHANIAIPADLERKLRLIIVTPDMHRTHHSVDHREGNSNFGQLFPYWDKVFGTYVDHPANGEAKLVMGLEPAEAPKSFSIKDLLLHPIARYFGK